MKYFDQDKNPYYTIFAGLILLFLPIAGTFIVMKYFKTSCRHTAIMQGFASITALLFHMALILSGLHIWLFL